jgi:hypothetical protein
MTNRPAEQIYKNVNDVYYNQEISPNTTQQIGKYLNKLNELMKNAVFWDVTLCISC